ncbi:DUF2945 domain-containing protein [Luteolibacter arcticus]|uniref:DUF2945 domain-containing protein n=1 Tax=Luteolibacter arcticus TaxID=1581411 RepID=A0ABT3GFE0_9BACT|nr:DUF2945 domain-containing protein [Luteolibacter arcticus]MCW1922320.1 DUF2945 domain-containing protein [Luteolibacter arcticus]
MKPESLHKGDKVEWETSQGKTQGKIVRKLTAPRMIKGHKVAASKDGPQYLVESEKSGEQAAHRPEALTKRKAPSSKS